MSKGCILNGRCLFDLSSRSDPRSHPPSSGPPPQTLSLPSTSDLPAGQRRPGLGGRSWSVRHALCRAAVLRCIWRPCCYPTAAAWGGLYPHPVTAHSHLCTQRNERFGWKDIAHRPVFGSLKNQRPVIKALTEGYVDVSLFSRHGDYDRIQTFLSPLLQTFKPCMIHFLRGLKLLHVAPQDTRSDEEEQREGRRKTQI